MSTNAQKEEVLAALKEAGIQNLDELAEFAAKKASEKDENGNPIVLTAIISPGFFVSH